MVYEGNPTKAVELFAGLERKRMEQWIFSDLMSPEKSWNMGTPFNRYL
jgi:hypothetical protein